MGDVEEQQDWLGINLQAIINQELDRIEQRNGEGFTPTFERDLAHRVISLGFALFSARGNTIGGTMLACELQKAVSGDALTALQAERDALRAALIQAGRAAGAGLADTVSTEFLLLVPAEVQARLAAVEAERDAEKAKHRETLAVLQTAHEGEEAAQATIHRLMNDLQAHKDALAQVGGPDHG